MLRGHATAKADSKGRLKIPAEFLPEMLELCGDDRSVFLTSRDGKMLLVYPLAVWEEHERELSRLPSTDPNLEHYLRTVNFWGKETSIDAAGRILVHPLLRDAAGIDGTVSVFGAQRMLEICDFETFRGQPPVVTRDQLAALAQQGV
jgi:MraZ protein